MSKIALEPNAAGTGTFTIASPATNTDRTLTLPDEAGTVLTTATAGVPVNGPAFSAYKATNQSITTSTWTKVSFPIEEYDTAGAFSSDRFMPLVAGYYQVNWSVGGESSSAPVSRLLCAVWKNGSEFRRSTDLGAFFGVTGSTLVYLNGSTDYIEIYAYITATTPKITNGANTTSFNGFLARSAT
jgi:hypothetical protein